MIKVMTKFDSGMEKVLCFLKSTKRGTILTVDDLKTIEGLSYTNIRTIFVLLCTKNILIRVCRGVYCYPIIENGRPVFPDVYLVLSYIAKKDNYEICPTGEYAEYLMGIRKSIPNHIICYNNDKKKSIKFENGISVIIVPSKRFFSPFIKNTNLRMLINYINNTGIKKINEYEREKMVQFYNNLNNLSEVEKTNIPFEIVSFLNKRP